MEMIGFGTGLIYGIPAANVKRKPLWARGTEQFSFWKSMFVLKQTHP